MKNLVLALLALAIMASPALALGKKGSLFAIKKPLQLTAGTSKRMHVTFNHASHKEVKCRTCHHHGLPGNRYASCSEGQCHAIKGPRRRETDSLFMAFHDLKSDHSCRGCHATHALTRERKGFIGCQPCHHAPRASTVSIGTPAK